MLIMQNITFCVYVTDHLSIPVPNGTHKPTTKVPARIVARGVSLHLPSPHKKHKVIQSNGRRVQF